MKFVDEGMNYIVQIAKGQTFTFMLNEKRNPFGKNTC